MHIARWVFLVAGVCGVVACRPRPAADSGAGAMRADSIVLERSRCFGSCPAYRLSLTAHGTVTRTPLWPRDTTPVRQTAIPPDMVDVLAQEAQRIGFFGFPSEISQDKALCPMAATDHATATVTIFRGDSATKVVDYLGCYAGTDLSITPALARLRAFESRIDRVGNPENTRSMERR